MFILDRLVHFIVDWVAHKKDEGDVDMRTSQSQTVLLENQSRSSAQVVSQDWKTWKLWLRKLKRTPASDAPDVEAAACPSPSMDSRRKATNAAAAAAAVETASPHDDAGFEASGSRLPITPGVGSSQAISKRNDDALAFIIEGEEYGDPTYVPEDAVASDKQRTGEIADRHSDVEKVGDRDDVDGEHPPDETGDRDSVTREQPSVMDVICSDPHHKALHKMGLLTAAAIFLHNFPEGLATFVGTLSDAKVGIGIAIAIAVHNVPEGICVALPIYYATGSRWRAFFWAFLSGMSEPAGALVGWLALYGDNSLGYAIVFALVGGMMVYISIKELIPMALRYDPKDKVASTCVVLGMIVMALSLVLFTL